MLCVSVVYVSCTHKTQVAGAIFDIWPILRDCGQTAEQHYINFNIRSLEKTFHLFHLTSWLRRLPTIVIFLCG